MPKKKVTMGQLNFLTTIESIELNPDIVLISDRRFKDLLIKFSKCKYFVFDIETYGTTGGNGLDYYRGGIRLFQVKLPGLKEIIIVDTLKDETHPLYPKFLQILCAQISNDACPVVGHNLYFDLCWMRVKYGTKAVNVRDTMILSTLRYVGVKQYRHSLAAVYERATGKAISKEEQMSDWSVLLLSNSQLNYAAMDVVATEVCYVSLCQDLRKFDNMPSVLGGECDYKLTEICQIECNSIPAFVEIAVTGLPINIDFANQSIAKYEKAIKDLYLPLGEKLGLTVTAQPVKLAKAIYDHYNIWLVEEVKAKDIADEDDEDEDLDVVQLSLVCNQLELGKVYPAVPINHQLTTSSAVLFQYYIETGEEDLLKLSLCRSLKKCLDSMIGLRDSAIQNNGYARGGYRSLGSTGTGRSTCGGSGKNTMKMLNLQNLPNEVSHALIKRYELPAPRDIIQSPGGTKLSIIDLSAAHSRYCARFSDDATLNESLGMKDPHLLITSVIMNMSGADVTVPMLLDRGGKNDTEIAEARSLGKTCYYLSLNVGGYARLRGVFTKAFVDQDEDSCKLAIKAFGETFPDVIKYQRNLHRLAGKNTLFLKVAGKLGSTYPKEFCYFRTQDGRLIHLEVFTIEKIDKNGDVKIIKAPKIGDCTSAMMISIEAIAMKKAMTRILRLKEKYPEYFKLIGMCHDELILEIPDSEEGLDFTTEVYTIVAEEFTLSLAGTESGMIGSREAAAKTLCVKYSEK